MKRMFNTKAEKLAWGATLKVGDIVNDCRFRDIAIKEIVPCRYDGVRGALIGDGTEIFDYDLRLEDGADCSLMHCCNHPDEVPDEDKVVDK